MFEIHQMVPLFLEADFCCEGRKGHLGVRTCGLSLCFQVCGGRKFQPFIHDSQIAHLLERDQGEVAFCAASLVKNSRILNIWLMTTVLKSVSNNRFNKSFVISHNTSPSSVFNSRSLTFLLDLCFIPQQSHSGHRLSHSVSLETVSVEGPPKLLPPSSFDILVMFSNDPELGPQATFLFF